MWLLHIHEVTLLDYCFQVVWSVEIWRTQRKPLEWERGKVTNPAFMWHWVWVPDPSKSGGTFICSHHCIQFFKSIFTCPEDLCCNNLTPEASAVDRDLSITLLTETWKKTLVFSFLWILCCLSILTNFHSRSFLRGILSCSLCDQTMNLWCL